MNSGIRAAALALGSMAAGWAGAQTTPSATLLALSKQDHTLSIIDPVTLQVVGRVPVGDDPHEVVASADGKTAYVSNYGFGSLHTLAVIDLVGQKQMPFIDLGALRGPHGLMFAEGKVFFTAEAAKAIGSYDPATGKIDWIMGTGQDRTHMLYVFPGGKRILTTNVNSATVTILDKTEGRGGGPGGPPPGGGNGPGGPPPGGGRPGPGQGGPMGPPPGAPGGDWELTVIPVGRGSEGFDVSPDGREAWVANAQDGTISVIDLTAKKVVATLAVNVPGANRLKFTPDGRHVLVTPGSALVVLDAATRNEVKRLPDVHGSGGIQMQPDGKRAYVACGQDGVVAVIDLEKLEMVGKVAVSGPDGLAWAVRGRPDGQMAAAVQAAMRARTEAPTGAKLGDDSSLKPGAEILSDTMGVDFSGYMRRLHRDIQRNWGPLIPAEVQKPELKSGIVGIRLSILPDGRIGSMKLEHVSGDVALDKAAWMAITGEGQYPPLPREFHGPRLELRVGFFYNTAVAKAE